LHRVHGEVWFRFYLDNIEHTKNFEVLNFCCFTFSTVVRSQGARIIELE
jgi:hypothetical protein